MMMKENALQKQVIKDVIHQVILNLPECKK